MAKSSFHAEYKYSKWSVSGNNLIVVTGSPAFDDLTQPQKVAFASAFCDSQKGLGADNIIFLGTPLIHNGIQIGVLPLQVIEPTGELASMCGNGLGCAAAHLAHLEGLDKCEYHFSVPDESAQGHEYRASVQCRNKGSVWDFNSNVGKECSGAGEFIKHAQSRESVIDLTGVLDLGIPEAPTFFTVVGEPHLVVIDILAKRLSDLRCVRLRRRVWERGRTSLFPRGTNIMCTTLPCNGCCYYRPFERNGRETSSCSTGAAAILASLCWSHLWPRLRALRLMGPGGVGSIAPATWHPHHVARYRKGNIVVGSRAQLLSLGFLRFPPKESISR